MAKKKNYAFVKKKAQPKPQLKRERLIYRFTDKMKEHQTLLWGILILLVGILVTVSFFDGAFPPKVQIWMLKVKQLAGWGSILVGPFVGVLGALLVLRYFGKGVTGKGRVLVGVLILLLMVLVGIHFLVAGSNFGEISAQIAFNSKGAGWIGYVLLRFLGHGLGATGTMIFLVAGVLLSIGLLLNKTVAEMLQVFEKPMEMLIQNLINLRYNLFPMKFEEDFTPVTPEAVQAGIYDGELASAGGNDVAVEVTQNGIVAKQAKGMNGKAVVPKEPVSVLSANQTNYKGFDWELPDHRTILQSGVLSRHDKDADLFRAGVIEQTLDDFGVPAKVVEIHRGPNVTQFCVKPGLKQNSKGEMQRVRIGKITSRADDLALVLASRSLRIQAPVPGKGYLGIEVPNEKSDKVTMRDIIETSAFDQLDSPLRFTVGKDVAGNAIVTDLAKMPHLLIAGATNSGKSVALNAIISCMLLFNTPDELRFIMVDPKRVELTGYDGIPHLLNPVIIEPEKATRVLRWTTQEMDRRYLLLKQLKARNIAEFNKKAEKHNIERLPYIVIVIDELGDLMVVAREQIEAVIIHLAKKARSAGIHLILSTQRPSVDVLTGLIKSNIPSRIAFAVASSIDSQVILDQSGAEHLLGKGDMLFKMPNHNEPVRIQGVYLSDEEIMSIVDYWRGALRGGGRNVGIPHDEPIGVAPQHIPLKQLEMFKETGPKDPDEEMYDTAVQAVRTEGKASTSWLQRKVGIGYNRAAKYIDRMEEEGIISEPVGNTYQREILDFGDETPVMQEEEAKEVAVEDEEADGEGVL